MLSADKAREMLKAKIESKSRFKKFDKDIDKVINHKIQARLANPSCNAKLNRIRFDMEEFRQIVKDEKDTTIYKDLALYIIEGLQENNYEVSKLLKTPAPEMTGSLFLFTITF